MEIGKCVTIVHVIIARIPPVTVTVTSVVMRMAVVRSLMILVIRRCVVVIVVNVAVQVVITVFAKDKVDRVCRWLYASNTRMTYLCRGATTATQATTW